MVLDGLRVIEFAGLAPGPFAGLVLADWGADVIRVDRPDLVSGDTLARNKRSIVLDVKSPTGRSLLKRLIARADVLIDPFRPGVLEKLGFGPDVFLSEGGLNKGLIYARLAGFSPSGIHKDMAGHDLNYLALSGVLSMLPGDSSKPSFPLNLVADFGGGGLTCALGILVALLERTKSGLGQVVQTDMVSGTRYLATFPLLEATLPRPAGARSFRVRAFARSPPAGAAAPVARMRGTVDGGAPFYNVYTCADGRWMAVACLEPHFYAVFVARFVRALPRAFLDSECADGWRPSVERQFEAGEWPRVKTLLERGFRLFDRDHWAAVFHGSDACAVPVLSPAEAAVLASQGGASSSSVETIPAPHPALSRTPARPVPGQSIEGMYVPAGQHTEEVLKEVLGLSEREVQDLKKGDAFGGKAKL